MLLFGKQLHTVNLPDIDNEQERSFTNAMRKDEFDTILELKMKGYRPSEALLKRLRMEVTPTTFIAVAKIYGMDSMLKGFQNAKPAKKREIGGMEF